MALLLCAAACNTSPFREVNVDLTPAASSESAAAARGPARVIRMSVANMESPRDTYSAYARLFEEVGRRMGMEVEFVQRRTYVEVNDLLAANGVDAALLCTGGYLAVRRSAPGAIEVVVVPIIHGSDTYQSLLIVPSTSPAASLSDLEGKRFAFTDELSLTGRAWVLHAVSSVGKRPETFFGSTVFTGSHDRSITAVARGVVDGAAVHSVIYDHILARDPSLAAKTRVIGRSPPFGMTPIVVSTRLPPEVRSRLRQVFLTLGDDEAGAAILHGAQIDRFAAPAPGLFDTAAKVLETR